MKKSYLAAGLAVLLLGVIGLIYRPVRVLTFCLAVLILAFALLSVFNARKSSRSACFAARILSLLLAMGLTVFAVLEIEIVRYGRTDNERAVSAVVILGAGVNGTTPSLSLRVRLDAALAYIADKPDIPIVVTGGQGSGEDVTEARCMADWLIAHGVGSDRIYLEEQASNTRENVDYSLAVLSSLGIDPTGSIAVVTADYHLLRARLYWGTPFMVPVAANMPSSFWPLTLNYYIRESLAVAKLLVFGG